MRLGAVFPTSEIGNDPAAIRAFAVAAEELGYHHLVAYDHVLGANADGPHGRKARYTHHHAFHEPFVLFGYLAGVTSRIELFTGIIVLPQRQTTLVAKQAAEIDVLSQGRLRLGIAVGPNAFEYEALGADFTNRGQRIDEQIELLRRYWTEDVVTFAIGTASALSVLTRARCSRSRSGAAATPRRCCGGPHGSPMAGMR